MTTTTNYQPGDVALVQCSDGEWRRAMYWIQEPFGEVDLPPRWFFADGKGRYVADSNDRPLLVLDVEDGVTAKTIHDRCLHHLLGPGPRDVAWRDYDALLDALRSLLPKALPPRPEEPLGVGAVARDGAGNIWTRLAGPEDPTQSNNPDAGLWRRRGKSAKRWHKLAMPVTVLFVGIDTEDVAS